MTSLAQFAESNVDFWHVLAASCPGHFFLESGLHVYLPRVKCPCSCSAFYMSALASRWHSGPSGLSITVTESEECCYCIAGTVVKAGPPPMAAAAKPAAMSAAAAAAVPAQSKFAAQSPSSSKSFANTGSAQQQQASEGSGQGGQGVAPEQATSSGGATRSGLKAVASAVSSGSKSVSPAATKSTAVAPAKPQSAASKSLAASASKVAAGMANKAAAAKAGKQTKSKP